MRNSLILIMILQLAWACKKSKGTSTPDATCQLMTTVDSSWDAHGDLINNTRADLEYDQKGQLISISSTNIQRSGAEDTRSDLFQYDQNGYRTNWDILLIYAYTNGTTQQEKYQYRYNYLQGRLVRLDLNVQVDGPFGHDFSEAFKCAYDESGNLSKFQDSVNSTNQVEYDYGYLHGTLQTLGYTDPTGAKWNAGLDVNSQGWPTRIIINGGDVRRDYDMAGNGTKYEVWLNGSPMVKFERTYDQKKSIWSLIYPIPKGFPNVIDVAGPEQINMGQGTLGQTLLLHYSPVFPYKNNVVINRHFVTSGAVFTASNYDSTSYTYNSSGYPLLEKTFSFDATGHPLAHSKAIYTFTGCK